MGKSAPTKKKSPTKKKGTNMNKNIVVKIERVLDPQYIDKWKSTMKSDRSSCCISGCKEDIFACAVVKIIDKRRKSTPYYIPVCSKHTQLDEEHKVGSEVKLAEFEEDPTKPPSKKFCKIKPKKDKKDKEEKEEKGEKEEKEEKESVKVEDKKPEKIITENDISDKKQTNNNKPEEEEGCIIS